MGSTAEPERFGKVRPLGSKGSNPLQVLWLQGRLAYKVSLRSFRDCEPSHRQRPHFNFCLALRLLLFLGCSRISGQRQNDKSFPYMEDHL